MLRKLTLALVASASLGAAALASTAASASPYWLPHHHHHHHGHGLGFVIGGGYGGEGCYQSRRVWTPYGYRFRVVNVCAW
jgi:hypothetical protein